MVEILDSEALVVLHGLHMAAPIQIAARYEGFTHDVKARLQELETDPSGYFEKLGAFIGEHHNPKHIITRCEGLGRSDMERVVDQYGKGSLIYYGDTHAESPTIDVSVVRARENISMIPIQETLYFGMQVQKPSNIDGVAEFYSQTMELIRGTIRGNDKKLEALAQMRTIANQHGTYRTTHI